MFSIPCRQSNLHWHDSVIALLRAEMKLRQNFSIIIPLQGMECLQALPGSIRELWILVHLVMERTTALA